MSRRSRRYGCEDCGTKVTRSALGWYMVHDRIWAESGLGPHDGYLCVPCLERRIGRSLVWNDFRSTNKENFDYWGGRRMVPRGWWKYCEDWASTPLARAARRRRAFRDKMASRTIVGRETPLRRLTSQDLAASDGVGPLPEPTPKAETGRGHKSLSNRNHCGFNEGKLACWSP
jgi:hypothetical protein